MTTFLSLLLIVLLVAPAFPEMVRAVREWWKDLRSAVKGD